MDALKDDGPVADLSGDSILAPWQPRCGHEHDHDDKAEQGRRGESGDKPHPEPFEEMPAIVFVADGPRSSDRLPKVYGPRLDFGFSTCFRLVRSVCAKDIRQHIHCLGPLRSITRYKMMSCESMCARQISKRCLVKWATNSITIPNEK